MIHTRIDHIYTLILYDHITLHNSYLLQPHSDS